jgi:hypothetical protein
MFGMGISNSMVIYGVYIRFSPTLHIIIRGNCTLPVCGRGTAAEALHTCSAYTVIALCLCTNIQSIYRSCTLPVCGRGTAAEALHTCCA